MIELPPALAPNPARERFIDTLTAAIFDPLVADEAVGDGEAVHLNAYALLDASRSPDIPIHLDGFGCEARCLFDGQPGEDLAEVAPYLVRIARNSDVWEWFVEEGWGRNWGILIHSRWPLARLKTHLKRFLMIERGLGERNYFKYYRPEHFATYLPVLEPAQIAKFFSGIEAYLFESEGGAALGRFSLDAEGVLQSRETDLGSGDDAG